MLYIKNQSSVGYFKVENQPLTFTEATPEASPALTLETGSILIHLMDFFNKTINGLINCSKRVRIRTTSHATPPTNFWGQFSVCKLVLTPIFWKCNTDFSLGPGVYLPIVNTTFHPLRVYPESPSPWIILGSLASLVRISRFDRNLAVTFFSTEYGQI